MRITNSMMTTGVLRDLSWSLRRMQHTQEQLATGRQLVRASDDPAAAATALALRHQSARAGHFNRSATDAQGWLETADSTLTSALDRLNRAKEITVQASSSGGLSNPSARQGMSTEIQAIRADLISLANTKYNGRSLFNGTAVGDAYDAAGQYQGNSAAVLRDVAPQTTMQVNSTGPSIFGTQGGAIGNMFEILDRLSSAITTGNDTAMAAEHTNLENAMKNLGSATVDLGSRAARLGEIQSRAQDEALRLKGQLSEVEDVDVVDATVRSKEQETAYTAALQVAAKVLPPSLVDYLR